MPVIAGTTYCCRYITIVEEYNHMTDIVTCFLDMSLNTQQIENISNTTYTSECGLGHT